MPCHILSELSVIWPELVTFNFISYYCPYSLLYPNHTGFLAFLWLWLRTFALALTSRGHSPLPHLYLPNSHFIYMSFQRLHSSERPPLITICKIAALTLLSLSVHNYTSIFMFFSPKIILHVLVYFVFLCRM